MDETSLLTGKERVFLFVEQNRRAILVGFSLVCVAAVVLGNCPLA